MIPPSTTITREGRRLRRTLLWALGALVLGNLLVAILGPVFRGERVTGPAGSSYVTTALGSAALAELLADQGVPVDRLRAPFTADPPASATALVMIEVGFAAVADPELAALTRFVEAGGRLLLAGPDPDGLLDAVGPLHSEPEWSFDGAGEARSTLPGVELVPLSGRGSILGWDQPDGVVLRTGDGRVVVGVEWRRAEGTVVWIADSQPFLNRGLAGGDSAGLAVSLLLGHDVLFDEYHHGFGGDSFLDLLPGGWPTTLLLLTVAGLAWMVAYGRRLGPPEEEERALRPERAAYVEAVASILERSGDVEASARPVADRARRLIAARVGMGPGVGDEDLRRAAQEIGLNHDDIDAWLRDGDLYAAGRVLARLSDRR